MDKRALALIKWEFAQLPKALGGLNVSNLFFRNMGLICKWVWRYFSEPWSLWRQMIKAKYKYPASLGMGDLPPIKVGGPWKSICNHLLKHHESKEILKIGSRKRIGDGKDTLFWHDVWLSNAPLKITFPRLFLISSLPMAPVASMGSWENSSWTWSLPWTRPFRTRDIADWEQLHPLLLQVSIQQDASDTLIWNLSKDGNFSVKSFYEELHKNATPCMEILPRKIWNGLVPFRIEVFTWLAVLERINTKRKLSSLGIIPPSETRCVLCESSTEDVSHLFLFCPFASDIWSWWWCLWNISWVWPKSLEQALIQWVYPKKGKFFKQIWLASFQVIIWSVWRERNERIFNNKSSSPLEIKNLVLVRLCWWLKSWKIPFLYTIEEVLRNPQCLQWGGLRNSKTKNPSPSPVKIRSE